MLKTLSTKADYQASVIPDTRELPTLPKGWIWTNLSLIAELKGGITKGQKRKANVTLQSVPYLRVANVQRGYFDLAEVKQIDATEDEIKELRLLPGDILFNEGGDRDKLGRGWVWRGEISECIHQNHVFRARLYSQDLQPKFVSWYGNSLGQQYFVSEGKQTTNLASINLTKLGALPIPLPPANEQHRIVAEVETQFTRLDAAVTALRRVQANLKRYRASVLQAACEGRLVPPEAELARAEGRSYEPADQLLEHILQERRAQWEAEQLAHMQAQGKVPKDERWKSKYKEPVKPDTRELPVLPAGWVWTNLSAIAELKGGITKGQKRKSNDILHSVPYLRVANVQRGFLDLTDIKQIEATEDEIKELLLSPGDILFNEGGDRDKLGRGWVWRGEISNCIHQNHVFRARLYLQNLQPKFVSWYGNSHGQQYFMSAGRQTTNLASINLTKLGALPVPLPPLPEQHRIVAEVERRVSVIDELEAIIAANLKRAERLRQAILKRAFEGKLVPQDPTDEPASVLLERIRAECIQLKETPKVPQKSASPPRTVQPTITTPVQSELALRWSSQFSAVHHTPPFDRVDFSPQMFSSTVSVPSPMAGEGQDGKGGRVEG